MRGARDGDRDAAGRDRRGGDDAERRIGAGGARRDVWRGIRDTSRGSGGRSTGAPGSAGPLSGPEVEELPAQAVLPRGAPRLGLTGTLAVVAMLGLLAAGFGVLGGRPATDPGSTNAARASESGSPASGVLVAASPRVTPWIECAHPPTSAPRVQLQVDGVPTDGIVEVIGLSRGSSPQAPMPVPTRAAFPGPPIEVPIGVIAELWIVGGACALAWTIDLVGGDVLDVETNPTLNPASAAQNRFGLTLAPYRGRAFELQAVLTFPNILVRATWPIHVLTFDPPVAMLESEREVVTAAVGCDVNLNLGNQWAEQVNPCADDLDEGPAGTVRVRPGEPLTFSMTGWDVVSAFVVCGRQSGHSFVATLAGGCELELDPNVSASFDVPVEGEWTLAISACALEAGSVAVSRICGTWYANVEVRD